MKTLIACLLLVLSTFAVAQDRTAEVVAQPPPARALPRWNLGVGIGMNVYGVQAPSGLGNLGALGSIQPRFTLLVERRLKETLFLTFQAAGSYGVDRSVSNSEFSARSMGFQADVGVRHVLNPRGIIEVSWFGTGMVNYSRNEGSTSPGALTPPSSYETFSVGAAAGLTLERELIEGLALRFSSSILGFNYHASEYGEKSQGFAFGLRLSPALEVRYAF